MAALFAVEPETWPVFLAYAKKGGVSDEFTREHALEMLDGLADALEAIAP